MYDPAYEVPDEDIGVVVDPGERIIRKAASITGARWATCPWQAMLDPFVGAVVNAHRWRKSGELTARWPEVPHALASGIEIYDAALQSVIAHDMREAAKEQERKATKPSAPGGFRRPHRGSRGRFK